MPKVLHQKKKKQKKLFCIVNLLLLKFATAMVMDCPLTAMAGARDPHVSKKATSLTNDMRLPPALFILTVDKHSVAEVATWRSRGRILRTAELPLNLQQLERGR